MKILKLWRTFTEGFKNFYRNGWLSFATISILTLSLYIVSLTLMIGVVANLILKNVEEKVNVSVYFNPEVKEEEITGIKQKLENYREIKSIEYVSKERALSDLLAIEGGDSSITSALEEIGENPLLASLVIKANESGQYEIISQAIKNSNFNDKISEINYERNKIVIERLNKAVSIVERAGLTVGLIFVLVSILITFNTIRLTLYSHKQEFEIMRLVGASNMYVRMPFVFEGIFYGLSAGVLSMVALLATAKFVSPLTQGAIPQGNVLTFYFQNFWLILVLLLAAGSFLGIISSFITIRRYLKT